MIEAYLRANNMFVDYNEVNQPYPLHVGGFSFSSPFWFLYDSFYFLNIFSLSKSGFTRHI